MELTPGTRLGRYEVIGRLALGGMAEVYLGRLHGHAGFTRLVALKRMLPEYAQEPGFLEMFLAEASMAAHLSHPNIVSILDFAQEQDEVYLAMEYIHGGTFRKLIREANRPERAPEPLSPWVAAMVGCQVAEALAHAWEATDGQGHPVHLVHRDVSPQNILISYMGEVKLADFGIARPAEQRTTVGTLKGKLLYMAPEQIEGGDLDARTDVFALGAVIYEAACGMSRPVFDAPAPEQVKEAVRSRYLVPLDRIDSAFPKQLSAAVMKALERRPENRFQSSAEFGQALRESLQEAPPGATVGVVAAAMRRYFGNPPIPAALAFGASRDGVSTPVATRPEKGTRKAPRTKRGETQAMPRPEDPVSRREGLSEGVGLAEASTRVERPRDRGRRLTPLLALASVLAVAAGGFATLSWSRGPTSRAPPAVTRPASAVVAPSASPIDAPSASPIDAPSASPIDAPSSPAAPSGTAAPQPKVEERDVPSRNARGTLVVVIRPWGFAWVGSERLTRAPNQEAAPLLRRSLPVGTHVVHVSSPEGARRDLRVTIREGRETRIVDPFGKPE